MRSLGGKKEQIEVNKRIPLDLDKKQKRRSDVSRSGSERTSENLLHKSNENAGKKQSKSTFSEFWKLTNELQLFDECLFWKNS